MPLLSGTTLVARARVYAQDTSTTNPAVSDANAVVLLNNVLVRWSGDVKTEPSLLSATATGLTFSAGDAVKTTTADNLILDHILAAYESDTAAVGSVLPPQLQQLTVEEMLALHNNDYNGTVSGSGTSGWQYYAWEPVTDETSAYAGYGTLRVYVWPALNATRYLILRAPKVVGISALTDAPDLTVRDAEVITRLLAWEMARLHTRDEAFLQQILAPLPSRVLDSYFEAAKSHGWMQSGIRDTGALGA